MNKHTFQVGDIIRYYFKNLAPMGTLGVVTERREVGQFVQIWSKALDRIHKGVDGWIDEHAVDHWIKHDTDFRVGDWVRYEGVEDGHVPELEGEVGVATSVTGFSSIGVKFPAHWNPDALWNKANIVKIQPPQEEKKMDIRSKEDGTIVRDVTEAHEYGYKWVKYLPGSRTEYSWEYWEPAEEWVKIEVEKSKFDEVTQYLGSADKVLLGIKWRYPK